MCLQLVLFSTTMTGDEEETRRWVTTWFLGFNQPMICFSLRLRPTALHTNATRRWVMIWSLASQLTNDWPITQGWETSLTWLHLPRPNGPRSLSRWVRDLSKFCNFQHVEIFLPQVDRGFNQWRPERWRTLPWRMLAGRTRTRPLQAELSREILPAAWLCIVLYFI